MGQEILGRMEYDNLLGGYFPRVPEAVTLAAGQAYPVGSVLGKAADGKCALVDKAKSDGTQEVYGVLVQDVDATAADTPGVVCLTGEFNRNHLTFAAGNTWQDHVDAARKLCLFFREPAI